MTEFQAPRKGMRVTAWIVIIALVVGVGGGWLLSVLTGGGSSTPSSVYVTTANGGSIITDGNKTLLTLTAVGNSIVKVNTSTKEATPSDAATFFTNWNDTYGDAERDAVVTATGPDGDVQLVLRLSNAEFSQIGYVVEFDAKVVSGPDTIRDLSDVTLILDAD
jgi:hypothetical protein